MSLIIIIYLFILFKNRFDTIFIVTIQECRDSKFVIFLLSVKKFQFKQFFHTLFKF